MAADEQRGRPQQRAGIGDRRHHCAAQPSQGRATAATRPEAVELAAGAAAGVEVATHRRRGAHPDLLGQQPVEAADEALGRDHHRQIEVGHLAGGVDAGVGPSRADDGRLEAASHDGQRPLELALHRAPVALALPAAEAAAEVGHGELYPVRHRGYPRMGRR